MKITFHPQSDGSVECILDGLGAYKGCALWVTPTRGKCGGRPNHFPLQAESIAFSYIPPENPPGYQTPPELKAMLLVHCSGEIIGRVIIPDHMGAYEIISADEVEEISPPPPAVAAGEAEASSEHGGGEMSKKAGTDGLTGKPVEQAWFNDGVQPPGDVSASAPSPAPEDHAEVRAVEEMAGHFAEAAEANTPPGGALFDASHKLPLGHVLQPPAKHSGFSGWEIAAALAAIIALAWGLHQYFSPEKATGEVARAEAPVDEAVKMPPEPPAPAPAPETGSTAAMHAPVSAEPQAFASLQIPSVQAPSEQPPSAFDFAVAVQEQSPDPDERLAGRLWKIEERLYAFPLQLAGAEDAQDAALIALREEFAVQIAALREEIADAHRMRDAALTIAAPEVPAPLARIHEHGREEEMDRRVRPTPDSLPTKKNVLFAKKKPRKVREISPAQMRIQMGRSLLAGAKAIALYYRKLGAPAHPVYTVSSQDECVMRYFANHPCKPKRHRILGWDYRHCVNPPAGWCRIAAR